jgi:hydrogenase nickel incorporation protein HypA/HybF
MHELALTCAILDIVEDAAHGRRVLRVTLEIGRLSGVMTDAIRFCFDEAASGTAAESAVLDIREIDGRARCRHCGAEFATPDLYTACDCGALEIERLQGEELVIKSIELEEAA